jgi:hypothetical protein
MNRFVDNDDNGEKLVSIVRLMSFVSYGRLFSEQRTLSTPCEEHAPVTGAIEMINNEGVELLIYRLRSMVRL